MILLSVMFVSFSSQLTLNGVIGPEGHLNVIPFQEAACPCKRLGEHNILICPKGEGLHRYGLKLERLIRGKLCTENETAAYSDGSNEFDDVSRALHVELVCVDLL